MPSATPPIAIAEMSETNRVRRRARVYRQPMNASTGMNMSPDYTDTCSPAGLSLHPHESMQ